jgi:hypothetical protein
MSEELHLPDAERFSDIPPEVQVGFNRFVGKLKDVSGAWPKDLEAQTTVVLRLIVDADEETLDDIVQTERLFKNSANVRWYDDIVEAEILVEDSGEESDNKQWYELPEYHSRRQRARRLAACLQSSIDSAQARVDAEAVQEQLKWEKRATDYIQKLEVWNRDDLEAQVTALLEIDMGSDEDTLAGIEAVEDGLRKDNGAWYPLPEDHTREDRLRRLARVLQWFIEDREAREYVKNNPPPGADPWVCPRCEGDIPVPGRKGEYEGAVSRTTRDEGDPEVRVCSPCGTEESYQQASGCLTPQSEWPIPIHLLPPRSGDWSGPGNRRQEASYHQAWEEYRASHVRALAPPPVPREVPDLRLHLMEKWNRGGAFEKSLLVRNYGHSFGPKAQAAIEERATGEREALRIASLWWIRDEMVKLTIAGGKSIPDDVRGSDVKLPDGQSYGFAVLGTPWIGSDAEEQGLPIQVDAIVWAITNIDGGDCISISMYRYFDFAGGLSPHDMREAMATGAIFDATKELVGNGPMETRQERLRGGSWIWMGRSDWPLKETLSGFEVLSADFPEGTPYTQTRMDSMIEDRRFFASFCVLVNHKLSQTEMVWAPRAIRKRAEKAGVDSHKEPSHVRLIRLREVRRAPGATDEEHEKKQVEWTHRWISSAHIGWRRCGPGHKERRLSYIPASIKGPEDKELIIKENVRVWTR